MQAFNELMLTGSVSEAARNLNRSQPAISALIAALEDEFGMKLFERRGGRLHPVPEAHYLKEECSELLDRIDRLQNNMRGMTALKSGKLDIASMPGPSVHLLPELVADFAQDKPEMACALISRSSEAVFQLVAAQQYDLGISDYVDGKADNTSLVSEQRFAFECRCAVSRHNPLAQKAALRPADLANEPMALLYDGHETNDKTRRAFGDAGQPLNIKFTTQYFIPMLTYVEKNLACAIVDPIAIESYRLSKGDTRDIVFLPFKPVLRYRVSVLTPTFRQASRLSRAFKTRLMSEFKRLGGVVLT